MQNMVIEGYRVSPQQRRLWSLQRSGQDTPYRSQCIVLMEGDLDVEALEAAIQDVIGRHEILRTAFVCPRETADPFQIIRDDGSVTVHRADLSGLQRSERQDEIQSLYEKILRSPFDFSKPSLVHACIARLSPREHALILGISALCADATTIRNFAREISVSYDPGLRQLSPSEVPLQYADLCEWQNDLLESQETAEVKKYWSQGRDLASLDLRLPFENHASPDYQFDPARFSAPLDLQVRERLESVAGALETSVEVFLLACWRALLARLTGQPHITVGVAYDGRRSEEIENAFGLFARYLPIHSRMEEQDRFGDLLKQLERSVREAARWQEYFNWDEFFGLESAGENARYLSFCFETESHSPAHCAANISFSIQRLYSCTERFKVKLSCVWEGDSLTTVFYYDAGVISASAIACLADQYHTLLESAVNNPDSKIALLESLSAGERKRLVVELNDTKAEYPNNKCVHELFEEQVERTPENIALVFEDEQLSYAQLNIQANRLANHLKGLGVGAEAPVGIFMRRSPEMVVALLAVLKAGGAYVPLDPLNPLERLAFMLDEIKAPVIITQQALLDNLPAHWGEVICLDDDWQPTGAGDDSNPDSEVCSENLAYVIYTSGSTGKPKGVMATHRGAVNYLDWSAGAYELEEGSGTIVQSSIGFDLTVTSLLTPLVAGQKVRLLREGREMEEMGEALRKREKLSLVKITPGHLEMLGEMIVGEESREMVRRLVVGGEQLKGERIRRWQSAGVKVVNEYGPTETVVGCCVYEVKEGEEIRGGVAIGRPIANMRMYVLDNEKRAAAAGVAGEIYIGGDGVARGYIGRAEETAERFVPDEYGEEAGGRLYRTGDLGRIREDGEIEYIGRNDRQVKIRGYRVEMEEVEREMEKERGVKEGVVEVREEERGGKRLIGYVVKEEGEEVSERGIKEGMRRRVPEYMVPKEIVIMERMPLTGNGKVDRRRLPEPGGNRPEMESRFVPPRTYLEQGLAEIWAKTIDTDRVGVNDHFFDLGGHSLLATQIVSRVRERYGTEVPMAWFFTGAPTVAALAELIEQDNIAKAEVEDIEIALEDLESLSDEEVRALLANRSEQSQETQAI